MSDWPSWAMDSTPSTSIYRTCGFTNIYPPNYPAFLMQQIFRNWIHQAHKLEKIWFYQKWKKRGTYIYLLLWLRVMCADFDLNLRTATLLFSSFIWIGKYKIEFIEYKGILLWKIEVMWPDTWSMKTEEPWKFNQHI